MIFDRQWSILFLVDVSKDFIFVMAEDWTTLLAIRPLGYLSFGLIDLERLQ